MRKLAIAVTLVPLLLGGPALAQERELGNIQRYGALWRYQKRDWSNVYGYANPGLCWAWNNWRGEWVWTC